MIKVKTFVATCNSLRNDPEEYIYELEDDINEYLKMLHDDGTNIKVIDIKFSGCVCGDYSGQIWHHSAILIYEI